MLSPYCEAELQDCTSLEEECLDDIKPDLISLTLSDSFSSHLSHLNSDVSSRSFHSSPRTVWDNNPSKPKNYEDELVQSGQTSIFSSPRVTEASEILNNENETRISTPEKLLICQQGTLSNPTTTERENTIFPRRNLSLSLHDVSSLPDFPLKSKLRDLSTDTIQSHSVITVSSGLKSKDSGLPRSVSCLSLSSSGRSFEHVQSKVKEYIRQIKETDDRRKSLKLNSIDCKDRPASDQSYIYDENDSTVSETTLATVIKDLRYELQDREIVLTKLQEDYSKLLVKYADAENRIDELRFKVIDPSLKLKNLDQKRDDHCWHCGGESIFGDTDKCKYTCKETYQEARPAKLSLGSKDSLMITRKNDIIHKEGEKESLSVSENLKVNLSLNPLIKPYSTSLRLKKDEPLLQDSRAKIFEKTSVLKLSPNTTLENGSVCSERLSDFYITQSDGKSLDGCFSVTNSYKGNVHNSVVENRSSDGIGRTRKNDCRLQSSEHEDCDKLPSVSHIPIPVRKDCNATSGISCKESDSNECHMSVEKVARWQESLPPLELIEPSCYGSLNCQSSGSKTTSYNAAKKFVSPGGHDSGYPRSELHSSSIRPELLKSLPPLIKSRTAALQFNKLSEQNTTSELMGNKHFSAFCDQCVTINGITTKNNCLENQPKLQGVWPDSDAKNSSFAVFENMQTNEHVNGLIFKPVVVMHKPLTIDSCECWKMDEVLSRDCEDSSVSVEASDTNAKKTAQDFHIPPLQLGNLSGGDDVETNNIRSGASSTRSSITNTLSGVGRASIVYLNDSTCDDSLGSSHQDTTEGITYPSSLCASPDSAGNKLFNGINKKKLHSGSISNRDLHRNSDFQSIKEHCDNGLPHLNYPRGNLNDTNIQNDSLQVSATTSTSYKSIKLPRNITDVTETSQKHSNINKTNVHNVTANISVQKNEKSPKEPFSDANDSDVSRKKLLGSALRCLLLELLNNENCHNNNCICRKTNSFSCGCVSGNPAAVMAANETLIRDKNTELESTPVGNEKRASSQVDAPGYLFSGLNGSETEEKATSCGVDLDNNIPDTQSTEQLSRVRDVNSVLPECSTEEEKYSLMKCLDEMDRCAQQLKERSETILNVLAVKLKPSSSTKPRS
ncbi:serine-rich adhesin for platelets-like [Periplaneta americana]|uniref:serine-rich adhesin for platelets-like n=1 Tax=Periplaneta americana TaxID=6978 RepID=UPI0037E8D912